MKDKYSELFDSYKLFLAKIADLYLDLNLPAPNENEEAIKIMENAENAFCEIENQEIQLTENILALLENKVKEIEVIYEEYQKDQLDKKEYLTDLNSIKFKGRLRVL